jgi:hypothetical protein
VEATAMSDMIEAVLGLHERLGAKPLNEIVGCWEVKVDARWWLACNGHKEPLVCSRGVTVQPFTFYVEYNGWPAGVFYVDGEGQFAAGNGANVETFVAALEASGRA